jgi:hypothetical protein
VLHSRDVDFILFCPLLPQVFNSSWQCDFMSTSNLRRRLHHGDVDGKKNEHVDISGVDSLNEPLLGDSDSTNRGSEVCLLCLQFHQKFLSVSL